MIKKYFNLIGNQDGAVAIIVALVMTTFLGFAALAIDVGVMGFSKNELQNAADAAALAGASELARQDFENSVNPTPIKLAAIRAAGLNHTSSNDIQISLTNNDVALRRWDWDTSDFSSASPPPYNAVEVSVSNHNVNLFFASDRGMGAHAVAIVGPTSSISGLRPFAIDEEKAQYFRDNPGAIYEFDLSPGNWGTADLDGDQGGGANDFDDWLEYGYDGVIKVGDNINAQTGVGPIVSNRQEAVSLIGKQSFIPVIDQFFGPGSSIDPTVVGFISLIVTDVRVQGANTIIEARYSEDVAGGGIDPGNQSFGVVSVKLVK